MKECIGAKISWESLLSGDSHKIKHLPPGTFTVTVTCDEGGIFLHKFSLDEITWYIP